MANPVSESQPSCTDQNMGIRNKNNKPISDFFVISFISQAKEAALDRKLASKMEPASEMLESASNRVYSWINLP